MTQIASLLAVATVFIGLWTLLPVREGAVIAAMVARRLGCGEDTDSNSDLDIDHAYLFLINRISKLHL